MDSKITGLPLPNVTVKLSPSRAATSRAPAPAGRGLATRLVLVGAAYALGQRWPSLWGTRELTDLGEAWIDRAFWASRVAPRTRRLPPMTPAGDTAGVARRNQVPDADEKPPR